MTNKKITTRKESFIGFRVHNSFKRFLEYSAHDVGLNLTVYICFALFISNKKKVREALKKYREYQKNNNA